MSVNRAVAIAATTDQKGLRSVYGQAVSRGAANTLCTPGEECGERRLVDEARRCAIALTRAIAATAGEPMLVPGELADALARLLVLYLTATTVR